MTATPGALLLSVVVVLVVCRVGAAVAVRLGQPAVIGELVGGMLVGPTLFSGALTDALFPAEVRPALTAFADVGMALFMFLVGLELDRSVVRRHSAVIGWLSGGSLVVPFALGVLVAPVLLRDDPSPHPVAAVVFLGLAMAVTAFPVLARILADRNLTGTRIGGIAIALAAVGDLVAWSALAILLALTVGGSGGTPAWRLLLLVPYGLVMFLVVPRLLRLPRMSRLSAPTLAVVALGGVLASGAFTEWAGLHLIFGAFLLGAVVPRTGPGGALRDALRSATEPVSSVLMPFYFVVAALQINLSHWDTAALGDLGLILLVAIGSKLLGVYGAARIARLDRRSSAGLATLMNVRGLTELVLLTVGLRLRIIGPELYSLMTVMAVVATVMSGPLLRVITGPAGEAPDASVPGRPAGRRISGLRLRRSRAPGRR